MKFLSFISWLDIIAFIFSLSCWLGYNVIFLFYSKKHLGIAVLMDNYRKQWISTLLDKVNVSSDVMLLSGIRVNVDFFARTTILIIAGLVAGLVSTEKIIKVISLVVDYNISKTLVIFKIIVLIIAFVYAFFEFTFCLRIYNMTCILMGCAPLRGLFEPKNQNNKAEKLARNVYKHRLDNVMFYAGKHYFLGLRTYYFGLSTLAWFVSPEAYMVASFLVLVISFKREFYSDISVALSSSDTSSLLKKNNQQ